MHDWNHKSLIQNRSPKKVPSDRELPFYLFGLTLWKHFKRKAIGVTVVMNVRSLTNLPVFIATTNRLQYVLI